MPLPHRAHIAAAAAGILAGALCLTWLATPSSRGARPITANAGPYQRYDVTSTEAVQPNGLPYNEGPADLSRPRLRSPWAGRSVFRLPDSEFGVPDGGSAHRDDGDVATRAADHPGDGHGGAVGDTGQGGGDSQGGGVGDSGARTAGAVSPPPAPNTIVFSHTQRAGGKRVALTFDDGPSPAYTPQILAVLRQYQVKATFCLIGSQVRAYPALVRQITAEGHRLCDHTMSHDERLPQRSASRIKHEILDARDLITATSHAPLWYYRAPGGAFSAEVNQIAAQGGLQPIGWSVDTEDWKRPGVESILGAVHRELRPGGVILMHDGGGPRAQSVAALRQLIPWLVSQGYQFDFPA